LQGADSSTTVDRGCKRYSSGRAWRGSPYPCGPSFRSRRISSPHQGTIFALKKEQFSLGAGYSLVSQILCSIPQTSLHTYEAEKFQCKDRIFGYIQGQEVSSKEMGSLDTYEAEKFHVKGWVFIISSDMPRRKLRQRALA
jgi:hypothetical protein